MISKTTIVYLIAYFSWLCFLISFAALIKSTFEQNLDMFNERREAATLIRNSCLKGAPGEVNYLSQNYKINCGNAEEEMNRNVYINALAETTKNLGMCLGFSCSFLLNEIREPVKFFIGLCLLVILITIIAFAKFIRNIIQDANPYKHIKVFTARELETFIEQLRTKENPSPSVEKYLQTNSPEKNSGFIKWANLYSEYSKKNE